MADVRSGGSGPSANDPAGPSNGYRIADATDTDDAGTSPGAPMELPSVLPLDSSNEFLTAPDFDVDAFLLSRSKGVPLSQVSSSLEAYEGQLKAQLEDVVDRDFRGFVALGTNLKAEGPRIARLAWQQAHPKARKDEGLELDSGPHAGALGLNTVREQVERARDGLRTVEEDIKSVMEYRDVAARYKEQLALLLDYDGAFRRLETILVTSSTSELAAAEANEASSSYIPEQGLARLDLDDWESSSDEGSDGRLDDDEFFDEALAESFTSAEAPPSGNDQAKSSLVPPASGGHSRRKSTSPVRRRSSLTPHHQHHRRTSTLAVHDGFGAARGSEDVPQRIVKARAELHMVRFLEGRARAQGLDKFVDAYAVRQQAALDLLRRDVTQVIEALATLGGPSRLAGNGSAGVGPSGLGEASAADAPLSLSPLPISSDLERWSCVALHSAGGETAEASSTYAEARKAEQVRWFEMALRTWQELEEAAEAAELRLAQNGDTEASRDVAGPAGKARLATILKDRFVEPWAAKVIAPNALNRRIPPSELPASHVEAWALRPLSKDEAAFPDPLRVLYNDVLAFIARDARTLAEVADRVRHAPPEQPDLPPATPLLGDSEALTTPVPAPSMPSVPANGQDASARALDFFGDVLWDSIANSLMGKLGGQLFFVGKPEIFHKNYRLTTAFLESLESLAPSPQAAAAFMEHPLRIAFERRWQLPVYFQMRSREIVVALESCLGGADAPASGLQAALNKERLPLMGATAAALTGFLAPWRDEVHLPELAAREWRLSLQVISRYRGWLEGEVPSEASATRTSSSGVAPRPQPGQGRLQNEGSLSGYVSPSRSVTPSRVGTPSSALDAEAALAHDEAALRGLTVIAADALWFEAAALRAFDEMVVPKLRLPDDLPADQKDEIIKAMRDVLQEAASFRTTLIPSISQRVLTVLKARCAEPLRLVRSLSTQAKGKPSTPATGGSVGRPDPSYFVPQILRPLKAFLGKGERVGDSNAVTQASCLEEGTRNAWAQEVVDDVASRFAHALQAMNRNFESLRRLKRGNQSLGFGSLFGRSHAEGGSEPKDPEAERQKAQMMADVDALEADVRALEVVGTRVSTATDAWHRLRAAAEGALEDE